MKLAVDGGSATVAVMSPLAASMYLTGMPWYACAALGIVGMFVYASRQFVLYRLGSKALDKATANRVPELMATLTREDQTKPQTCNHCIRRKNCRSETR